MRLDRSYQLPLSSIHVSSQQFKFLEVLLFTCIFNWLQKPYQALVRCAEDVIHTLAEMLPFDGQMREHWVLDLERLKEKLYSAVHFILQTLRAVSKYHHNYNKACLTSTTVTPSSRKHCYVSWLFLLLFLQASSWYSLVLHENFLQELLSGVKGDGGPTQRQRRNWGTIPAWRHKISTFLWKNPPPDMEELVHLAHLSNVIPDDEVQQAGKQMSQRWEGIELHIAKRLSRWLSWYSYTSSCNGHIILKSKDICRGCLNKSDPGS